MTTFNEKAYEIQAGHEIAADGFLRRGRVYPSDQVIEKTLGYDAAFVNGHRFLPSYGHRFSPAAAMVSPRWWPSVLPSALSSRSLEAVGRKV